MILYTKYPERDYEFLYQPGDIVWAVTLRISGLKSKSIMPEYEFRKMVVVKRDYHKTDEPYYSLGYNDRPFSPQYTISPYQVFRTQTEAALYMARCIMQDRDQIVEDYNNHVIFEMKRPKPSIIVQRLLQGLKL